MDFKVVFRHTFVADLEHIVRRIALQNAVAAQRVGESAIQLAENLAFFPERHPRIKQRPDIRRFIVAKRFMVYYRVRYQSRTVEILRFWDAYRGTTPF